jgi:uncharacterized Zn finger protein (UPF0148 family)
MTEKTCSKCSLILPVSEFRKQGNGWRSECKVCGKLYRENHREDLQRQKAAYYQRTRRLTLREEIEELKVENEELKNKINTLMSVQIKEG